MRLYKLLFSLISVVVLSVTAVWADDTKTPENTSITLATNYLKAYSTFDVTKMEPFFSEDAVFFDPTSTTQNASGGPFFFEGREAILKGLGDYSAQYASFDLDYKIERQYESNGVVIFIANLTYTVEAKDGQKFTGSAPIVTTIATNDGKITRHTDYFDYKSNTVNFSD